ncbi:MAG: sulfatase activating formylglycine-generating enzyme [Pseudohongiellaceae bacterium]|jgi:formylglycine-generating enzyme required for sulfatase activity
MHCWRLPSSDHSFPTVRVEQPNWRLICIPNNALLLRPTELSPNVIPSLLALAALLVVPAQAQANPAQNLLLSNDAIQEVRLSSVSEPGPPPSMVFIPGGEVTVGTEVKRVDRLGDGNSTSIRAVAAELPRHMAEVRPFFLDRTEVTNRQWKVYLDATGRKPTEWVVDYSWGGKTDVPKGQDDFPITNVSFVEIRDFLAWCGKRLPNENEWTLAARGEHGDYDYPWGKKYERKFAHDSSSATNKATAVGTYPDGASPFGLLDMAGNVWEWVDSPFSPFEGFKPVAHKLGRKTEYLSPVFDRTSRIAKGGSYVSPKDVMRIDYRLPMRPTDSDESVGFRAARSYADGADLIRHAHKRLLPVQLPSIDDINFDDVVAKEITTYSAGSNNQIITGHRYLAFAHPMPKRGSGLAKLRKDTRDEPLTLGLLTTSESIEEPALPPGDYLLAYKGKGESKAHKQARRDSKGSSNDNDEQPAPAPSEPDNSPPAGASVPWPGINVSEIIQDIDYPQDKEVILFYNVNGAVVGYTLLPEALEKSASGAILNDDGDGKDWTIQYSHDNMARNKKAPRFSIKLKLHGEGLGGS